MRKRRRHRLFVQIFAVMFGGLLATQLISLAVVLVAPPGFPPAFAAAEIGDMLKAPDTVPEPLTVRRVTNPGFTGSTAREVRLAGRIAEHLKVPARQVRVALRGHPMGPRGPFPMLRGPGPGDRRFGPDTLVIGDFEAALQRADGGWVVVATPKTLLDPWQWRAIAWLLVSIVIVSIPAWLLARRVSAPIARFAEAAERLGRDPEAPLVAMAGSSEVDSLAGAFNMMQQRLQRYVQDRTQMIAAIAHDLRTPLMRLSYLIEKAPPDVQEQARREIDEMNAMIGSVLGFVRDRSRATRERIDLRSVVEGIVEDHSDAGVAVTLAPGGDIVVHGDLLGLRSIFNNLIDNAAKYGGRAVVSIGRHDCHAVVLVDDEGAGLAEGDLERVFEPFYRGEPSRNRGTGGMGLGLAIVRSVARAHGGEVTLHNLPSGGLRARVLLPL
ncbi:sensor histidine kinase [Polymorphobacter sp.]|uniref:sensor histidine kinase n=1 Tax=Polymorphobacter sp. TaxID=1909290 RepID=UPI003F70C3EF